MKIGLLRVELFLPMCNSLKVKRSILKHQIFSLRKKYNVGVSEIGKNDAWKHAQLGIVAINSVKGYVERLFAKILNELEKNPDFDVAETKIEIL